MANLEDLERRIRVLEDIEAIKSMKRNAFLLVDTGKVDDAIDSYAETAVAEFGPMGSYQGKESIKAFLSTLFSTVRFMVHQLHDPRIEITSESTAKGTWRLQVMLHMAIDDKAYWVSAYVEDEYVKENGEWKTSRTKDNFEFITEYEQGWAKQRMAGLI